VAIVRRSGRGAVVGARGLAASVRPVVPQGGSTAAAPVAGAAVRAMPAAPVTGTAVRAMPAATMTPPVVGVMRVTVVPVPAVVAPVPDVVVDSAVVAPVPDVMVPVRVGLLLASPGQSPLGLAAPLAERPVAARPGEPKLPPGRVSPHPGPDAALLTRIGSRGHDPVHDGATGHRVGDDRAAWSGRRDRCRRPDGPGERPEQPARGQHARNRERPEGRRQDVREAAEGGHHAEGGGDEQGRQRGPAAGSPRRGLGRTVRARGDSRRRGDLRWARTEVRCVLLPSASAGLDL
jgi:hypothetical protein